MEYVKSRTKRRERSLREKVRQREAFGIWKACFSVANIYLGLRIIQDVAAANSG